MLQSGRERQTVETCVYTLAEQTKGRLKAFISDISRSTPERLEQTKDEARRFAFYVEAAVVPVLRRFAADGPLTIDPERVKDLAARVREDAHPNEPQHGQPKPDNERLDAIEHKLDLLAGLVSGALIVPKNGGGK